MEVYRHVGERVRKELEAVLRTWKEPPQGSRDPRPVLPAEVTSRIENAVIKFRTIAIQHQQPSLRQMPARGGPYRESPTPVPMNMPGGFIPVAQPGLNGTSNPVNIAEMVGSLQQRSGTPTFSMTSQYPPQPAVRSPVPIPALPVPQSVPLAYNNATAEYRTPYSSGQPAITQAELQNEVREIHQKASIQNLLEPNNVDLQQLITTLESLKHMLDTQQFGTQPLQQMQAELNKINTRLQAQLSAFMGNAGPASSQVVKPFTPPTIPSYPVVSSPPPVMNFTPPPTALPTSISQPPQLDISALLSGLQPAQHQAANSIALPPSSDNSLLAQLRAAGLVPSSSTPELRPAQSLSKTEALVGALTQDSITKV
jgi:pre-mRNA cleavage complex 2 protein Pcf11